MNQLSIDQENAQYDTKYQRSLQNYITGEALVKESNYRKLSQIVSGSARPTLDDLHDSTYRQPADTGPKRDDVEAQTKKKGKVIKFGWIQGVLMRCMLNIWGVMLFLRVSWMVGQCGLIQSLVIVLAANTVTIITSISMSAVATNGLIQGGGVYYMISRSLGPAFGGSIGLMFTIANSIAVATYIIGFVESLQDMLYYYFNEQLIIDGGVNDIRAVGTLSLVLLMALAIVGMDWVTRVQMALLVLLICSQIDVVVGVIIGPMDDESKARGFVGWNTETFQDNVFSDYRRFDGADQNIISVFAVYFTAVTGIVAGANLSGDLKDPSTAIPKGTLLAIAITLCSYIIYPFLLAGAVVRDASGKVDEFTYFMTNNSDAIESGELSLLDSPTFSEDSCSLAGAGVPNTVNNATTCEFGAENSTQVMELIAAWGPLIYAGCFAATLSSAIASLVGAPRVLQALAKDKLYPGIEMFSKGWGANNDPVRGYVLVFLLSFACIMIGNLNAVSTLLSNFFLASYSLINFSCFHASFIRSPGWRPSFKYYNQWISMIGGLLCLVVMFLIDYITGLATLIITVALYLFVSYRKPDVNWGDSTQAAAYASALNATIDLDAVGDHVKNFRPQILVLSGQPSSRPALLDLGQLITKNSAMLSCGHVTNSLEWKERVALLDGGNNWLKRHKINAFYKIVEADDLGTGTQYLYQLTGLGKLKPNMVLMGHKSDWQTCSRAELSAYFSTLHSAFSMQLGIAILRVPNGLDYSQIVEDEFVIMPSPLATSGGSLDVATDDMDEVTPAPDAATGSSSTQAKGSKKRKMSVSVMYRGIGGGKLSAEVLNNIGVFQRKQSKGNIDVWWLYDDGGLTLLLPYILSTRSNWSGCSLRIFTLANRRHELDVEQRSMANLLAKFRIDYGDVLVIPDVMKKPSEESRMKFEDLIKDFRAKEDNGDGCTITDSELNGQREKTNRHIRVREMLLENSKNSNLVVMTLPMPRTSKVSASLYMAWLDYLSKDMPPFLFVRGNQQSVLTFYS